MLLCHLYPIKWAAGGQYMVWKVSNRFTHLLTTMDPLSSRWPTLVRGCDISSYILSELSEKNIRVGVVEPSLNGLSP